MKLENNLTETARNINSAFGSDTVTGKSLERWFESFRTGDMNLENHPHIYPESSIYNYELLAVVVYDPLHILKYCTLFDNLHFSALPTQNGYGSTPHNEMR